ncbi:hypothetical protein CKF54_01295 [Psittacicella hinzii]|uniref:Lipoprotein n=1 Tax=Psittacicella hinzii TaxID=2028575 RepID=A0A3A1YA70_9GAMM|nr:hypothetical protein [Psittacicella hinzii]RIY34100.1 hypothetical protein CKF54_01295 [Psittacicella hinzii]
MNKFKKLSLVATAVLAATTLVACNKEQTATTTTTQEQAEQTQQVDVYVKDFNPTQAFINRYTDREFNFNAALPLTGKFVTLLNNISNGARLLNNAPNDEKQLLEYRILATLNKNFNEIVDNYKNDKQTFELDYPNDEFDLEKANFSDLLSQLNTGCELNNNYQANIDEIKKLEVRDAEGKVLPFPTEVVNEITNWNGNFKATCDLTKSLYEIVSAPNFSYENLEKSLAAQLESRKAEEANQTNQTQSENQ